MGDESKRPLQIPPHYIPYLEKHRIYELFHELARELVIQQPADHVMFIKQILLNASKSRDVARVVLIASPRVNVNEIATLISKVTDQLVITERDVLKTAGKEIWSEMTLPSLLRSLGILTRTHNAYKLGWIMAGFIRNQKEAETMIQAGILPTHVIHIIPPFYPNFDLLLYCRVPSDFPEYRRQLLGLKYAFRKKIKEVYIGERGINEVVCECIDLINIRKGLAPLKPRVLLIGPRGSGRKTQARLLESHLNLVHVNFEYLLCQEWISDEDLGKKMRECKDEVCLHTELIAQVVNKRLLQEDCLTRGFVLTHYPYTEQDFRLLDCMETPPNRIIFLEIEPNVCRERLKYRKQNVYTGSKIDVRKDKHLASDETYEIHPKDASDVIDAEICYYCEQYGSLRKYAGGTANFVNADQTDLRVLECITAIISKASPTCPPRSGLSGLSEESSLDLSEASEESRCCCVPIPNTTIMDCYRNSIDGLHAKARNKSERNVKILW